MDENDVPAEDTQAETEDSDAESVQVVHSQPKRKTAPAKGKKSAVSAPAEKTKAKPVRGSKATASISSRKASRTADAEETDAEQTEAVTEAEEDTLAESQSRKPSKKGKGKAASSSTSAARARSASQGTSSRSKKGSISAASVADSTSLLSTIIAEDDVSKAESQAVPPPATAKGGMTRSTRSKDLVQAQETKTEQNTAPGKTNRKGKRKAKISVESEANPELENDLFGAETSQLIEVEVPVASNKSSKATARAETESEAESEVKQDRQEDELPKPGGKATRAGDKNAAPAARSTRGTRASKISNTSTVASNFTILSKFDSEGMTPPRIVQASTQISKAAAAASKAKGSRVGAKKGKKAVAAAAASAAEETESESEVPSDANEDAASVTEADLSRLTTSTRQYEGDEDITRSTGAVEEEDTSLEDAPTPKAKSTTSGSGKTRSGKSTKSTNAAARSTKTKTTRTRSQSQSSVSISEVADEESLAVQSEAESIAEEEEGEGEEESVLVTATKANAAGKKAKTSKAKTKPGSKKGNAPAEVAEPVQVERERTTSVVPEGAEELPALPVARAPPARLVKSSVPSNVDELASSLPDVEPHHQKIRTSLTASDVDQLASSSSREPKSTFTPVDEQEQDIQEIAEREVLVSPPREPDTAPLAEDIQQTVRQPAMHVVRPLVAESAAAPIPAAASSPQVSAGRVTKPLPKRRSTPKQSARIPPPAQVPRSTVAHVQAALDALLAGPMPIFDSPEKSEPPTPEKTEEEKNNLILKALELRPLTEEEMMMPIADWLAMFAKEQIEHFEGESQRMLEEWDRRTAEARKEVRCFDVK